MNAPSYHNPVRSGLARRWRYAIAITVAAPIVLYAGAWIHERLTHVYTNDAHIAAAMIALSTRVSGQIISIDLKQGDAVGKGDVLVKLDAREAEIQLEVLEARYTALAAEIDELEARIELVTAQGQSGLARARAQLGAFKASKATSEAELRQAEQEHRRLEPMARDGLVPEQALDKAKFALQAAQGRYRQAQAEIEDALAALEEAQLLLQQPELLRHQKSVLMARLQELESERRKQTLTVADHTILSPIDGVIDKVFVDAGEYINPGQSLVMMHTPGAVWVDARVKETALAPLRIGQPVRLHIDAFRERAYSGRLERITNAATSQFSLLPSPNPSGNFTKVTQRIPIRISIDDPDQRLSPGMMVEAYIDIRH